jgi:hypothetical protein
MIDKTETIEYVKIDKNFLLKQYKFLENRIREIENNFDNYPSEEIIRLRTSFQDLAFIISKTEPL